jgi:DNA-binding GntR family transcriptional regulator
MPFGNWLVDLTTQNALSLSDNVASTRFFVLHWLPLTRTDLNMRKRHIASVSKKKEKSGRNTTSAEGVGGDSANLKILPITVHSQTAEKLRAAILSGVFSPGERLVESRLCKRMGVSRPSVREALRRLEAERLIDIPPNRGPIVRDISWEEARQIYDVRVLLEAEATALFAVNASTAALRELKEALADFQRAAKNNNALQRLSATARFYDVILTNCGNRIIAELLQGLVARITFLRSRSMSLAGRAKFSAVEMAKIYEAVEDGDERAARKAAVDHVKAAAAAARKVFNRGVETKAQRRAA